MRKTLIVCAATVALALGFTPTALASPFGHHHGHSHHQHDSWSSDDGDDSGDDSPDTGQPDTVTPSADTSSSQAAAAGGTVRSGAAQTINAQVTGFSWQDNSPPGSSTVCCGVLHKQAGGTGTYADPITTAVPGSGGQGMETPAGTRIYVARLKRYFVVEDSGATKMGSKHFDLWVGGEGFPKSASDACMNSYTGSTPVIINPPAGEPVTVGPLTGSNGCKV